MSERDDILGFVRSLPAYVEQLVIRHRFRDSHLAITTGDAATTESVNGTTFSRVTVWLDGVEQTAANKQLVTLPYGHAAPGASEFWVVRLINGQGPGYLDKRLA